MSRFNLVGRALSWRDNIASAVVALQADLDTLRADMAAVRAGVSQSLGSTQDDPNVASRFAALQSVLEKHESVIADLELKLAAFRGGVSSEGGNNVHSFADVRGALDAEILDRQALQVGVRHLNRQIESLASAIAEEASARTELASRLAAVEAITPQAGGDMEVGLNLLGEELAGRMAFEAALESLKAELEAIKTAAAAQQGIAGQREDIDARLNALTATQRESAVNQYAMEKRLDSTHAELAERDSLIEQKMAADRADFNARLLAFAQSQQDSAAQLDQIRQQVAADRAAIDERLAAVTAMAASMQAQQEGAEKQAVMLAQLDDANRQMTSRHEALDSRHVALAAESAYLMRSMTAGLGPAGKLVSQAANLYINRHGSSAIIVAAQVRLDEPLYQSGNIGELVAAVGSGNLSLMITADPPIDGSPSLLPAEDLVPLFRNTPGFIEAAFKHAEPPQAANSPEDYYRRAQSRLRINPHVISALSESYRDTYGQFPTPLNDQDELPAVHPAQPRRRSVVFLHNNYYHFNVLANGLRKRGWDALTVSIESPNSPQRQFYHGEDVNLYDPDFGVMRKKVQQFFKTVPERFGSLHFYGQGQASFFPENYENTSHPTKVGWDFFELRRHRLIIGYMPTGCLDGARQSDIRRITGGLCRTCVWENEPSVCSDARSAAWADRLDSLCDWVGLEGDWVVGSRTGAKYVRGPVVTTLDPSVWSPEIGVPPHMSLSREPNEVLVYHAVGNAERRRKNGRDIKGSGAVFDAIETLQKEGLPVRLVFFSNVPSTEIKYYQVQADIVIDQLNYGRYGANARECMMLGRPVIGSIDGTQEDSEDIHRMFEDCPIVSASVNTITDVLRNVVQDAAKRTRLGRASRDFAVRWHGVDACAERYERIIDRLKVGLAPDSPDLYPARHTIDVSNVDPFPAEAAIRSRRAPAE